MTDFFRSWFSRQDQSNLALLIEDMLHRAIDGADAGESRCENIVLGFLEVGNVSYKTLRLAGDRGVKIAVDGPFLGQSSAPTKGSIKNETARIEVVCDFKANADLVWAIHEVLGAHTIEAIGQNKLHAYYNTNSAATNAKARIEKLNDAIAMIGSVRADASKTTPAAKGS